MHDNCRALWLAVLHRAILDAAGMTNTAGEHDTHQRLKNEARAFLFRPWRGFNDICSAADVDPEAIQAAAREAIKNPTRMVNVARYVRSPQDA